MAQLPLLVYTVHVPNITSFGGQKIAIDCCRSCSVGEWEAWAFRAVLRQAVKKLLVKEMEEGRRRECNLDNEDVYTWLIIC